MVPRPLCPPGCSQACAQGARWVQDHRPAPCIRYGKGFRGVYVFPWVALARLGHLHLLSCSRNAGPLLGCCFHMHDGVQPPMAGCWASGIEEHPQRGSTCLPRGRQGGLSSQGGLSRQAPGLQLDFARPC